VDFAVSEGLPAGEFRLEPLGPQHNAADYAASTASIGHIQATPGFAGTSWLHEMSLAEHLRDLERHAQDFAGRRGFSAGQFGEGVGTRPVTVAEGCAAWSGDYDEPNDLIDLEQPVMRRILDELPTGTALDAACGIGRRAASAHSAVP
jgi:hypothetical protein